MARQLTQPEKDAVNRLAKDLSVKNPEWLFQVIRAESGNDPQAANPRSSAKGLIQFVDSTARGLGYSSSQDLIDRHPDFIGQLNGPVRAYLRTYAPFPTEQSLWMSIFLPIHRNSPPDTVLEEKYRKANPGIDTVADYLHFVKTHTLPEKKNFALKMAILGVIALVTYRYASRP